MHAMVNVGGVNEHVSEQDDAHLDDENRYIILQANAYLKSRLLRLVTSLLLLFVIVGLP